MKFTETLTWHPVGEQLPDADLTILMAHGEEVSSGYLDGDTWRYAESGGVCPMVTHWAEPRGSQAAALSQLAQPQGEREAFREWARTAEVGPDESWAFAAFQAGRASLRASTQPAVPADVLAALDRMCTPLDESWLKGATAEADARCMKLIRDSVLGATQPAVPVAQDERHTRTLMAMMDAAEAKRSPYTRVLGNVSAEDATDAIRAALAAAAQPAVSAEARDAARYRWLREQQWNTASLFVIAGSKALVRLGTDCPSLDRLDAAIDAAMGTVRDLYSQRHQLAASGDGS